MDYEILERDFIERTMALLTQYETLRRDLPAAEQYNHTLLINCLLGLIILPNQKHITYIPNERIVSSILAQWGIVKSEIKDANIKTIKDLVDKLRNCVAHFDIEVISQNDRDEIDLIKFNDSQNMTTIIVFDAQEILPFARKLGSELIEILNKYKYNSSHHRP